MPSVNTKTCIVLDCTNTNDSETGGEFVGDLCAPCHEYITTGLGRHSQAFRNAINELDDDDDDTELSVNTKPVKVHLHQVCYAAIDIRPTVQEVIFFAMRPFRPHALGVWSTSNEAVITEFFIGNAMQLVDAVPAKVFGMDDDIAPDLWIADHLEVPECLSIGRARNVGITRRYEHIKTKLQTHNLKFRDGMQLELTTASPAVAIRVEWTGKIEALAIVGWSTEA